MNNNKKMQATMLLKGALLFIVLTVATACSGGGGPSAPKDNMMGGNAVPTATQTSLKMDLCDEVNGWETDCRFLGMKFIKQNPEEIVPLTEKHGRGRGRGGRDA